MVLIALFGFILKWKNTNYIIQPKEYPEAIDDQEDQYFEEFTIDELYLLNNNNLEVIYYAGTNRIKEIKGMFSTKTVAKKEDALQVLKGVRSLFEIKSFEYFCSEIDDRLDMTVYNLNQLYKEIPVEGGFFQIGVDNQGKTSFVKGNYVNVEDVQIESPIPYEHGIEMLNLSRKDQIQEIQLIIYGLSDVEPCLCWKYTIISKDPTNDRVIYMDAICGTIIYAYNPNIA